MEEKNDIYKVTSEDVYDVCRRILAEPKYRSMELAHAYARVGLQLSGKSLRTHILYLLANLTNWKGTTASECKKVLGEFISRDF